jgi:dihydroorotate dehydrogenase
VLHLLRPVLQGKATIISVGGIETAEQAQARLDAGATLVQGYTDFVYEGPLWARRMNRALK